MHEMEYLTIKEAADRWGLSLRRLQQLCKGGQIKGAKKDGRIWMIPASAYTASKPAVPKPLVLREKPAYWHTYPSRTGLLPLPIGITSYIEAVSRYYYVDKTLLIRDFIDTLPKVSLFTRPRRFGKTLTMDMLRVFFEISEEDTSVYFRDKKIWACGEPYRSWQGRFPVIYLSFKDVKYLSWENALKDITENIRSEYARHSVLADSPACNSPEKEYYNRIVSGSADEVDFARSLAVLSRMLQKHYGMEAIIIIDEYDTPVQQGYSHGYYEEVVSFFRKLFSGAFKDNPSLAYGFLTGILRVAKESIFSGMNNLKIHSVMEDRFSGYFGFTKEEVSEMLAYYGQPQKLDEVCEWYDGYRFGNSEIFNPWSVISYIDESCTAKAFWQATGSNEIIGDIISAAGGDTGEKLRRLMQGETVTASVDTEIIYPEVRRNPAGIFSFLLVAGYLKNTEVSPQEDGNYICRLAIPNKEIRFVFAKEILSRLEPPEAESTAAAVRQAVFEKDSDMLKQAIAKYLMQTISYFDTSEEAFYQGLLLGMCAILNNRYAVRSNRESGLGRFDIQLYPLDKSLPGFLFEIKVTGKEQEDLSVLAQKALAQITDKKYPAEMHSAGIHKIICIGVAFRGKDIVLEEG